MRSVVVVLPASICAVMPILRILSSGVPGTVDLHTANGRAIHGLHPGNLPRARGSGPDGGGPPTPPPLPAPRAPPLDGADATPATPPRQRRRTRPAPIGH